MYDSTGIFIGLLFLVVIFLVLRELWCWYWKINNVVDLLTKITNAQEEIYIISRDLRQILANVEIISHTTEKK